MTTTLVLDKRSEYLLIYSKNLHNMAYLPMPFTVLRISKGTFSKLKVSYIIFPNWTLYLETRINGHNIID